MDHLPNMIIMELQAQAMINQVIHLKVLGTQEVPVSMFASLRSTEQARAWQVILVDLEACLGRPQRKSSPATQR